MKDPIDDEVAARAVIDKAKNAREAACREVISAALEQYDCTVEPSVVFKPDSAPIFKFTIVAK